MRYWSGHCKFLCTVHRVHGDAKTGRPSCFGIEICVTGQRLEPSINLRSFDKSTWGARCLFYWGAHYSWGLRKASKMRSFVRVLRIVVPLPTFGLPQPTFWQWVTSHKISFAWCEEGQSKEPSHPKKVWPAEARQQKHDQHFTFYSALRNPL